MMDKERHPEGQKHMRDIMYVHSKMSGNRIEHNKRLAFYLKKVRRNCRLNAECLAFLLRIPIIRDTHICIMCAFILYLSFY